MTKLVIAIWVLSMLIGAWGITHAKADPFSDEVDCEDALAPMSAYGTERYTNGQDYCMSRYDHDRKVERRLKALENRDDE